MSHPEQIEFFRYLKNKNKGIFINTRVLEVGSLDINGSIRDFFETKTYLGVDIQEGPRVDLVAQGQDLYFPDNHFDVCVSAECFEHNPYWKETFANMYRMASSFVVFTCASDGRMEHGTLENFPDCSPFTLHWNYYKNLNEQDFRDVFDIDSMFSSYEFLYQPYSCDLYFWGNKTSSDLFPSL
jgi:hypothetical protein